MSLARGVLNRNLLRQNSDRVISMSPPPLQMPKPANPTKKSILPTSPSVSSPITQEIERQHSRGQVDWEALLAAQKEVQKREAEAAELESEEGQTEWQSEIILASIDDDLTEDEEKEKRNVPATLDKVALIKLLASLLDDEKYKESATEFVNEALVTSVEGYVEALAAAEDEDTLSASINTTPHSGQVAEEEETQNKYQLDYIAECEKFEKKTKPKMCWDITPQPQQNADQQEEEKTQEEIEREQLPIEPGGSGIDFEFPESPAVNHDEDSSNEEDDDLAQDDESPSATSPTSLTRKGLKPKRTILAVLGKLDKSPVLQLQNCKTGNDGMICTLRSIASATHITTLDLRGNQLRTEAIKELVKLVKNNNNIKHINLSNNPLLAATAGKELVKMLQENRQVIALAYDDTTIPYHFKQSLEQELETNVRQSKATATLAEITHEKETRNSPEKEKPGTSAFDNTTEATGQPVTETEAPKQSEGDATKVEAV
eukprot:TRINITY_DN67668_c7_g3_i1.p1 TRINITY_DN67668_c7_g3~~TRINITY_DN67668_c7_g3_i1.p1  ORF type:complete len:488 (+),score=43.23 TRINITY_DN67668_c7_g3_i1:61-1524(+)